MARSRRRVGLAQGSAERPCPALARIQWQRRIPAALFRVRGPFAARRSTEPPTLPQRDDCPDQPLRIAVMRDGPGIEFAPLPVQVFSVAPVAGSASARLLLALPRPHSR